MARWLWLAMIVCAPLFRADGANIGFSSSIYYSPVGQDVPLDLVISGLPVGVSVGAFDLTLHFDSSSLMFKDFIFGPSLGVPPQVLNSEFTASGSIEVVSVSLLSAAELQALQDSGFGLGTLVLDPTRSAVSGITVSGLVSDASGAPIAVSFGGTTVTAVPEPATPLLFCGGLLVLAASSRAVQVLQRYAISC